MLDSTESPCPGSARCARQAEVSSPASIHHVEELILARALIQTKSGMSARDFSKSLERYCGNLMSALDWQRMVTDTLGRLVEEEYLLNRPYRLTGRGTERVRQFFGGQLPGPGTTWRTITDAWIPAVALGLTQDTRTIDRLKNAEGFRGTVIRQKEQLAIAEAPTERQALDALVWRALGVDTDQKLSVGALHEYVLRRTLDRPRANTLAQLANLLAARLVGSRSVDLKSVRDTLGRSLVMGRNEREPESHADHVRDPRAIGRKKPAHDTRLPERSAGSTGSTGSAGSADNTNLAGGSGTRERDMTDAAAPVTQAPNSKRPSKPQSSATESPSELDAFVAQVNQAARSPTVRRFGSNKAFICSVFDALHEEDNLDQFKAKLIQAHRAGRINLRAANLVDAMDPELVRRSESNFMSSHYHFVEVTP